MAKHLLTALFCLVAVLFVFGQIPRTPEETEKWNTTGRACGSVRTLDSTQVGEQSWRATQKEVKKATVRLYRREVGKTCCDESELVGERKLDRRSTFSFDSQLKGKYWITVVVPDRKGKGLINLDPDKPTTCSKQSFSVDDKGNVDVGREITLHVD